MREFVSAVAVGLVCVAMLFGGQDPAAPPGLQAPVLQAPGFQGSELLAPGSPEPAPPAPVTVTFDQLGQLERQHLEKRGLFLAERGWTYNCDNPGSLWLWAKAINGKEYRLQVEEAIATQLRLDDDQAERELQLKAAAAQTGIQ